MDGAEGGAGQVGADEDALDLYGAAFELGGLKGDNDCDAALCDAGCLSATWHVCFREKQGAMEKFCVEQNRSLKIRAAGRVSCDRWRDAGTYTGDLGSMVDKVHGGIGVVAESYLLVHENFVGEGVEDFGLLVLGRVGLGGVCGAAEGVVFL